jgi:DUF1365 family protein
MQSCLYEGTVRHHRLTPVEHRFEYAMQFAYIDLDEAPELMRRGWLSRSRWSPRGLLTEDHFPGSGSIGAGVRALIKSRLGLDCDGPLRMLTLLRWRGWYFSPLNLYFVFASGAAQPAKREALTAAVAEVSNTPWRERHHYVVAVSPGCLAEGMHQFELRKRMHVSPFMEMQQMYRLALTPPGESLAVLLENWQAGQRRFTAAMQLSRRELTNAELHRSAGRYPATPLRVLVQIYYQAWRLWTKKCPLYPHPSKRPAMSTTNSGTVGS